METVTRSVVEAAVASACGATASVVSWKLEDFTASFCVLRSLKVHISDNNRTFERQFMVKQAPQEPGDPFQTYRARAFQKEAFFYETLTPLFNNILELKGEPRLRVPACYYSQFTPGEELLVMDDLRASGYKCSSQWILDEQHARLAVREAARLHALSILVQKKEQRRPLDELYPLLQESWTIDEEHRAAFEGVFEAGTKQLAERFCTSPHLASLKRWCEQIAPVALRLIMKQLLTASAPFRVVTHGDIHSRNLLFKYDAAGSPVDVMMVDMQVTRFCSLAVDVNYFTHFSLLSTERSRLMPSLLDAYYSSLTSVLELDSSSPPFTRKELTEEIQENKTGLLEALLLLPVAVAAGKASDCFKKTDEKEETKSEVELEGPVNDERREEIIKVLRELTEETNSLKIHDKFADIDKFLWTQ